MEFNLIAAGLELAGTTVRKLIIDNSIIDIEKEGKRSFGLYINEPQFQKEEDTFFARMIIDFEVEIKQLEKQQCKIQLSMEGVFTSKEITEEAFKELVVVNGAAALIGIARGKIEAISANIFNNGKIVIPFINVIDYYKNV